MLFFHVVDGIGINLLDEFIGLSQQLFNIPGRYVIWHNVSFSVVSRPSLHEILEPATLPAITTVIFPGDRFNDRRFLTMAQSPVKPEPLYSALGLGSPA
jgi:hypothetical protein